MTTPQIDYKQVRNIVREEVKDEVKDQFDTFRNEMNTKFENLKVDISENSKSQFTDFKSEVINHIDAVYKEVLAKREEDTVHTGQHADIHDTLEKHDTRLFALESAIAPI